MAGGSKTKPTETGRAPAVEKIREKLRKWKSEEYNDQIEYVVDKMMITEVWLFWYFLELKDLRARLSADPVLRHLTPIIDVMQQQLWQLMIRWRDKKNEVIRDIKELGRKRKKIKGRGCTIKIKRRKYVIDVIVSLHGSKTSPVDVPNLGIPEETIKILKLGWRASDASHNRDKPAMGTHQLWQLLSWLILFPGRTAHIYTEGVSISKDNIKIVWASYIDGSDNITDDNDAYRRMLELPKDFILSIFTALLGDGTSKSYGEGLNWLMMIVVYLNLFLKK